jgi:hypothetical protein
MGWRLCWVSAAPSDFNVDFGASATEQVTSPGEGGLPPIVAQNAAATGTDLVGYLSEAPVVSAFALQDGAVYQSYGTTWRGVEFLMGYYPALDRMPRAATRATPGRPGSAATTSTSRALEAITATSAPGGPTTSIPGSSWSSSRETSSSSAGRGHAGASGAAP